MADERHRRLLSGRDRANFGGEGVSLGLETDDRIKNELQKKVDDLRETRQGLENQIICKSRDNLFIELAERGPKPVMMDKSPVGGKPLPNNLF